MLADCQNLNQLTGNRGRQERWWLCGSCDVIASLACVRLTGWPIAWIWRRAVLSADAGLLVQHLPEPNRASLVGVYAVTLDPLLSLYEIIYVTWYTRLLPKATRVKIPVAFGTRSRDYQTPTRHALLGCQGQLQAIYSEFPKFHPNPFTSGEVIAEHVNIVETRHKVFPILGEASASLPSNKSTEHYWRCKITNSVKVFRYCIPVFTD